MLKTLFVFGFISLGPELPKQPPRILEHITKNLFVSIGKFGPIAFDHQPGLFVIGFWPAAY